MAMNRNDLCECIFTLCNESGISGCEDNAAQTALNMLKKYIPDAYISGGSVIGIINGGMQGGIVLDAHIDQVGFIVTSIDDEGFVKVGSVGGMDLRLMAAQRLIIHGKKDIEGVVCTIPPHLSKGETAVPEITDISIDCGMSRQKLESIVSIGDSVTFSSRCERLLNDRVTAHSLDDRCGMAAILYALSQLDLSSLTKRVCVCFTVQEEVGERGAKTAAFSLAADEAVAVDVSFAYSDGEKKDKCGEMDKGCMIGISPILDRELSQRFIGIAQSISLPYQTEVMSGVTGTNADRYSSEGCGARSVTLSIPLRYMHTPVEVISLADVENTGMLIAEYLRRCAV